jgi:hypothetical protein
MKQARNFIENNWNVCKQKVKKGWEEGREGNNSVPLLPVWL